jgi:peptide/nickel transport system substrate-binding protein
MHFPRIIAAALALGAMLACTPMTATPASRGPASRSVPTPRLGGTAVLTDYEYPSALSPLTARTDSDLRLGRLLFSPLWGLDPQLHPYPDLARQVPTTANRGVRVAPDGRSMTVEVQLVPGLRWSDGQPITVDDVIFTWRALTDPANHVAQRAAYRRITRMDRRSSSEVIWTMNGIDPAYLELGAGLFLLPWHRLQGVAQGEWSNDPYFRDPDVVSGPFTVVEAVAEDHLVMAANRQFSDGRSVAGAYPGGGGAFVHSPYLQRVVLEVQSGKAAEEQTLNQGAADVGFHLLPDDLQDVQGAPGATPVVSMGLRDEFLDPNHAANRATGRAPPWVDDPHVLEALDEGLDRAALVRDLTAGEGRPARGLYPRALAGFAIGSVLRPGPHLEAARRLLDAAGWAPGPDGIRTRDGRRLAFELRGICGRPGIDHELDSLRRQWLLLGAAVSTACQPRSAFLRLSAEGAFDMTVYSNEWSPDPGSWAAVALAGRPDGGIRCPGQALHAAFTRLDGTLDPGVRRSAAREAEREWLRDRCTIPVFEVPDVRLVAQRLRGFRPSPAAPDTWNAANWWLAAG